MKTIKELIIWANSKEDACSEGIARAGKANNFEDLKNYLKGSDWLYLLTSQPQFSEFCDWKKLDGSDWGYLLIDQPQFGKHKTK